MTKFQSSPRQVGQLPQRLPEGRGARDRHSEPQDHHKGRGH